MLKQQAFIAGFFVLTSSIVALPVQAHQAGQSLDDTAARRELNDLFERGKRLVDDGKFSEALPLYEHATSLDRENPQIFSAIGYLQALQSNFDAAAQAFQQAVALKSDNANYYYALAYSLANAGNNADAAVAYRRAIELSDNNVNAHLGLGVVLLRQQDVNGALAAFQQAITLAPNNAIARQSVGILLMQQQRFTEAIEVLQQAAELDPRNSTIQLDLGIAWLSQGDLPTALSAFRRAADLEPEKSGIVHTQIGRILQTEGNVEAALASYREAVNVQPDLIEARKAIADILLEQQNTLMAIVEHRQIIALAPTDAGSYYHLGLALRDRGRTDEAIQMLGQALNLYQQQGNAEAVQTIQTVLRQLQSGQ